MFKGHLGSVKVQEAERKLWQKQWVFIHLNIRCLLVFILCIVFVVLKTDQTN